MQNSKSRNDVRGKLQRAIRGVQRQRRQRAAERRDARQPQFHEDLLGEPRAMALPPTRHLLIASTDARGWTYVVQTASTAHAFGEGH